MPKRWLDFLYERFTVGQQHARAGRFDDALSCWLTAVATLDREWPSDRPIPPDLESSAAGLLSFVGAVCRDRGDLGDALAYYRAAAKRIERGAPQSMSHAISLHNVASILLRQGHLGEAFSALEQALSICDVSGERERVAGMCLNDLGRVYEMQGNLESASAFVREAIAIERASDPSGRLATYLNNLGSIAQQEGSLDDARRCFEEAVRVARASGSGSKEEAVSLSNLGLLQQDYGDVRGALQHLENAKNILEAIAPRSIEVATALNNIGGVHVENGDLEQAERYYNDASHLLSHIAPRSSEYAGSLHSLGKLYQLRGELQRAFQQFRAALECDTQIAAESLNTARDLNSLGMVHRELGDFFSALDAHRASLAIYRRIAPQSLATAAAINNVGLVYEDQGDDDRALESFTAAATMAGVVTPGSIDHACYLNNIGGILRSRGDLSQAAVVYRQALDVWKATAPKSRRTAMGLSNLGLLLSEIDEGKEAFALVREAVELAQEIAPHSSEAATALNNMGLILEARKDVDAASRCYRHAVDRMETVAPQSKTLALALSNLGRFLQQQKDWPAAIAALEQSISLVERLRLRAGGDRARESLFSQSELQAPYANLVVTLFTRHAGTDRAKAYHYVERSRARSLLELLSEARVAIRADNPARLALLKESRDVQCRLAALHNRVAEMLGSDPPAAEERVDPLRQQRRRLEERADEIRSRVRQEWPELADVEYPEPLTLQQVQEKVLDAGVLLLEYSLVSESLVWAVRKDDFQARPLRLAGKEIAHLVDLAIGRYHDADVGVEEEQHAREVLSACLFEAVPSAWWADVTSVLIIPDGPLYYLPFEILPWRGQAFGEIHTVTYAPSATVVDVLRRRWEQRAQENHTGDFVGFGDPAFACRDPEDEDTRGVSTVQRSFHARGVSLERLPDTRVEVEQIARQFGDRGKVYIGDEATEWAVKRHAGGYRYLHFATHGLVDDTNPMYSGLALSPPQPGEPGDGDDMLQVYEMFGMKISAELVVCSACRTGLGTIRAGEGLVGMSRGLFFAGARRLVVSLWDVPDVETSQLMRCFYEGITERNESVTEAMRTAKARLKTTHPDPFFWGAFVVVGDFRA